PYFERGDVNMANFDGKYSEHRLKKNKQCRHCKQTGKVYYLGSSVEHGNPFTPAADTEVDHYYACENCGNEWTEYA
ncbi:MAG: hypothetical protein AAFV33_19960, partial [Chloroflexota bacterium]